MEKEKKKKKMQHSCISAHLTLLISSVERNLPANAEDTRGRFDPWVGKIP